MNNKVLNKQIPLETIIKVANYLEDYREKFDKKFELEESKNKNLSYGEKQWEYEDGNTKIDYTIELKNGKNMTEGDYNWFVQNLNEPSSIKNISIYMFVSFFTQNPNDKYNNIYNKVTVSLDFREFDVSINIDTTNQESEAHNLYSEVMSILENNEDRYNKTMKHRKIRTQCFTISVGIILSYILYVILKINAGNISPAISEYLNNKYILIFGQWFIAILLGNVFSYWYIVSIYKPLLPETRYAGFNYSTGKGNYADDVDDYIGHSEVHFGKYWDAEKRRKKIEKIHKITSKIIFVQLLISIVLFLY